MKFDELSGDAQQVAIRNYTNNLELEEDDFQFVLDEIESAFAKIGFTFKTRAVRLYDNSYIDKPIMYWQVDANTSNFHFDGYWQYVKLARVKPMLADQPYKDDMMRIQDRLQKMVRTLFFGVTATITAVSGGASGMRHTVALNAHVVNVQIREETTEDFKDIVRELAGWAETQLRDQYDWLFSEQNISNTLEAMDWDFNEDGTHCD